MRTRHTRGKVLGMLSHGLFDFAGETRHAARGATLLDRGAEVTHVLHVEQGRVLLGWLDNGRMTHHLGTVEGPFWLNAGCAALGQRPVADAVADSPVQLRCVPLAAFEASLRALPAPALEMLRDVARAHRLHAEMGLSRTAKDAEARCAEWLLRHAQPAADASGTLAVLLQERKRMIAAQLGIAPETLSRVLRHLRERSLISGSGRVLNLLDPGGLRTLAGL